jgi:hypothetical protein
MSAQPVEMEQDCSTNPPAVAKKPRFKQKAKHGNSRARNDDAFRLKVGKKVDADYRAQRAAKFTSKLPSDLSTLSLKTPLSFTSRPAMPLVKRLPFSTLGLGLSISELFYRFSEAFRNSNCSIYSLLRVTLSQLDLQRQVSHEGGASVYPYESLFTPMDSNRRDLTKTHPDNFKVLIFIIESFGRFKHNGVDHITVIPSGLWKNPFFLTFSDLPMVVDWASTPNPGEFVARREFFQHNPLPGAVVDEEQWILINPNDYWEPDFTIMSLRDDFVNVTRLLEAMKTKFEQVMDRVTYSGAGKSSCLMSVRSPTISVPYTEYTPPLEDEPEPTTSRVATAKRKRLNAAVRQRGPPPEPVYEPRPTNSAEQQWYASEPLEDLEASLGLLSMCGVTTESLEQRPQLFRVRNQYNSAIRLTESWTSVFDEALPRIART